VPSRVRAFRASGVGEELFVDRVRDASLEAADRFLRLLSGGSLPAEVGAALGLDAQLGDGSNVDHVVDLSVAGSGESMAVLLTR